MRIKRLTLNNIGSFAGEHSFLFQTDNPLNTEIKIAGHCALCPANNIFNGKL